MSAPPPRVVPQPEGDRWVLRADDLAHALRVLRDDGLVVYPTDTLYGLGADPHREGALARLRRVKRRAEPAPLSVAVGSLEAARALARFSDRALEVWQTYLPGPLTLLLPATSAAPRACLSPEGTIGLRMPKHDVALQLARAYGPITATSANRHGAPPPRTAGAARAQLGGEVDLYIDAGPCPLGQPSTVVDLSGGRLTIKREGAIRREELSRDGG